MSSACRSVGERVQEPRYLLTGETRQLKLPMIIIPLLPFNNILNFFFAGRREAGRHLLWGVFNKWLLVRTTFNVFVNKFHSHDSLSTSSTLLSLHTDDIFETLSNNTLFGDEGCSLENSTCSVAIFEIYGGRIQDLLNNRNRLKVLEDGRGEVIISGLEEYEATNPKEFLAMIDKGHTNRTTHATEANDVSSRSHAICQVLFRDRNNGRLKSKLSLVDLAGSERGTDTKSHNRQRRTESSEINTSLLALKECIRAIDGQSKHVPYRQSKLTQILKDSFVSKHARTAMIATVSPGSSSADHTVNTLRYADRIKENVVGDTIGKTSSAKRSPMKQLQPKKSPAESVSNPTPTKQEAPDDSLDLILDGSDEDEYTQEEYSDESEKFTELDETVQTLCEEQDLLMNLHMNMIQESANLLTVENKLLSDVQSDDYDVDEYALRLSKIVDRRFEMVNCLKERLELFQKQLKKEEDLCKKQYR
jgi:kinesin family protein 2/24